MARPARSLPFQVIFRCIRPDAAQRSPGGFDVRHQSRAANRWSCLAIARPDHWIKHVLIIPGIAFAMIMSQTGPIDVATLAERLMACLFVAMALSSGSKGLEAAVVLTEGDAVDVAAARDFAGADVPVLVGGPDGRLHTRSTT